MSALPTPTPGLIVRYAYLWSDEHVQGRDEGIKNLPCAVVLTTTTDAAGTIVTVLPITHTPPRDPKFAIEIPYETKRRLGLDDDRSWVVIDEANRFRWPGPDLRPRKPGDVASVAYGLLPRALFVEIRDRLIEAIKERRLKMVARTE